MKKAAVMISDGRMKVIAHELASAGFEVLACTQLDELEEMERRAPEWDVLILPIRGIDSEGNAYDFAFVLNWSGVIDDERVKQYRIKN